VESLPDFSALEPATLLWWAAGGLVLLAAVSALAEHRRGKRRDLDRPGWVPWNLIQVLAILFAMVVAGMALASS
jgi:hypothetical protein